MICYPSSGTANGKDGDHVLLAPPYIVQANEIAEMIEKLSAALEVSLAAIPQSRLDIPRNGFGSTSSPEGI